MTFEQIGYFLALAEERSFVRAARRCGISQPSLSNAIKSLEDALGAQLFERTVRGSELTAFGKQMHPHLAQLHHDRLRALRLAHTYASSSGSMIAVRPQMNSARNSKHRLATSKHQMITSILAAALVSLAIVSSSVAHAADDDMEKLIRASLSEPVRCSKLPEPLFYCRHETAFNQTMVLDLASSLDGPSASLTHDYDDPQRHQFFGLMRRFFMTLGIPADAFDDCVAQAQWKPADVTRSAYRLLCYRVELGHRVTHEIFAMPSDKARPAIAQAD
jgi:molybdenum-dependent DNA-binding transcriptional regulator ModE